MNEYVFKNAISNDYAWNDQKVMVKPPSNIHPFVFDDSDVLNESFIDSGRRIDLDTYNQDEVLAMPFKTVLIMNKQTNLCKFGDSDNLMALVTLIAEEISPDEYHFYCVLEDKKTRLIVGRYFITKNDKSDSYYKLCHSILKIKILEIRKNDLGHSSGIKVKVKNNGKKEYIKIKNIIYVTSTRNNKNYFNDCGRSIQWSHAFFVMGHWRKIHGTGKDREGNYNVSNMTWVKDHARGEGELRIKTRMVS